MRACHVVYGYFPFDPRVRREVEALVRRGHDIQVIAARDDGEASEETVLGARVHRVPWQVVRGGRARYAIQYGVFFLVASLRLLLLHMRHRFHLVHIHSLPDFQVLGALPLRALGARLVLDLHEAMPEIVAARFGQGFLVEMARALETISCLVAHRILVVNEAIGKLLVGRGVEAAKVTVVMNSPSLQRRPSGVAPRLEHPPPFANGRSIVYVGGINKERDLELLIRATGRLRDSHNARLAVYGYGDVTYKERLKLVAMEERLGTAFFLGPALDPEEVQDYVALSEIGPITYERNPLTELAIPNKAFEYAAAKKPLVIADLKCLRALFGDAALYYAPGDPEDLADQIAILFDDADLRRRLAEKASGVLQTCRWEVMESRLIAAYGTGGT